MQYIPSLSLPANEGDDPMELVQQFAQLGRFSTIKPPRWPYYHATTRHMKELSIHFDGAYPVELLSVQRPNEPREVLDYRLRNYQPFTKTYCSKITNTLQRIQRADDWRIRWKTESFLSNDDKHTLQDYCTEYIPYFGNIESFVFDSVLPTYLKDPNAMIVTYSAGNDRMERPKPQFVVFNSEESVWVSDTLAVFQQHYPETYQTTYCIVSIYGVYFALVDKTDARNPIITPRGFYPTPPELQAKDILCVTRAGGVIRAQRDNFIAMESYVAGILPGFNSATQDWSDQQANKVLHAHPQRWEIETDTCKSCDGSGVKRNAGFHDGCSTGMTTPCGTCGGAGVQAGGSAFKTMRIKFDMNRPGVAQPPLPPMGYVEKSFVPMEFMRKEIDDNIHAGLEAVCFGYLHETNGYQSGVAKAMDRQEVSGALYTHGANLVRILKELMYYVSCWRYPQLTPEKRKQDQMPDIEKPTEFDVVTSVVARQEYFIGLQSGADSGYLRQALLDVSRYDYGENSEYYLQLKAEGEVDKLLGKDVNDCMTLQQLGIISKLDFVIHTQCSFLINKAASLDYSFWVLRPEEKYEVIKEMAEEIIEEELPQPAPLVPVPPAGGGDMSSNMDSSDPNENSDAHDPEDIAPQEDKTATDVPDENGKNPAKKVPTPTGKSDSAKVTPSKLKVTPAKQKAKAAQ